MELEQTSTYTVQEEKPSVIFFFTGLNEQAKIGKLGKKQVGVGEICLIFQEKDLSMGWR